MSDLLSRVHSAVTTAAHAVRTEATQTASAVKNEVVQTAKDGFSSAKGVATTAANKVESLGGKLDHPFVMGGDGFVAVDAQGNFSGLPPSARVREFDGPHSALDPLLKILGDGESRDVSFHLPGGQSFSARADGSGFERMPTSALPAGALGQVDPKRGGLVKVGVSSPGMAGSQSNVLVLPKNYDGPIFVCDIDDTLRDTSYVDVATGKTQPPIAGAKELLQKVAEQGIPIVYLSAGSDRIRPTNEAFLQQLPPGVLLDRGHSNLLGMLPINSLQARDQGAYKAQVLGSLEQTYPQAKLFGLGDDKYGDAMAYTRAGATAYIHDVKPGDANLPADFHGTQTKSYTPEFIDKVASDLKSAVSKSASFGGTPPASDWMGSVSQQLDALTGSKVTTGNVLQPLVDGENAFPEVLKTLDSAKKSIDYESYQFVDGDQTSEQVVQHLLAAKARGVSVRVQVDALGSRELPWKSNALMDKLKAAGIPVTVYHPLTDVKQTVEYHRDHRKSIIVDGSTAFLGGMNTGDKYLGGPQVKGRLHDVFVKMQGPAVSDVQNAFDQSWKAGGGTAPDPVTPSVQPQSPDGVPMRVITHAPGDENIRSAYLTLIDHAQKNINVENTYPMSDDLVDALCAAAQRGVDVKYVVGSDQGMLDVAAEKNFPKLLAAGVHVYMYPEGIHTKSMSVDGQIATFGSSNVDNVALDRDREIIGLVQDPGFTQNFDAQLFDKDIVGDSQGKKTLQITKWDPGLWTKLKDKLITGVWPDSYE